MEPPLKEYIKMLKEEYDRVCEPITETVIRKEVWIPMTDNVKLKTIVVLPEGIEGPFPTIVIRSCYYHTSESREAQIEALAKRGFAGVLQWCRGIGGSEGIWAPFTNEREDGLCLMNWLQNESWVKNIGYLGASYLAFTGWSIADAVPEKVKTMYLTVFGTEQHVALWHEGAFRQDMHTSWTMENAGVPIEADYFTSAKYYPQIEVDEKLWNCHLDWYREAISSPSRVDDYWTTGTWGELSRIPEKINIPIFLGEGWYDIQLDNSLKTFGKLSSKALKHSVLQINPGEHWFAPVIPCQRKQEHAVISENEQQIRWFTEVLKEEKMPEPSINYYLIGADEWRKYNSYPPIVNERVEFFLNGNNLEKEVKENSVRDYSYDPRNPVLSHGAETLFYTAEGVGSLEQPEMNWRDDVLSYCSEPLTENLDIVGAIRAKLWVESDAPDTCFTMKMMEVFPDGKAFNIRNGITTLAYRNDTDVPLTYDGGPIEITICCMDIAWRLQKGSKLRVDISSSNFPEYSVHPNTATVWSMERNPQIAHQRVLMGKDYPSRIILPIDGE